MKPGTGFILDASLLAAFLRPDELHHGDADALLKRLTASQATLFVPALAFAEVAAAIARGEDDTGRALAAVAYLSKLSGLRIMSVTEALGGMAAQVAAAQRIRGCDAVYVALVLALDATLITLDRQQRERALALVAVQTPGEALAEL